MLPGTYRTSGQTSVCHSHQIPPETHNTSANMSNTSAHMSNTSAHMSNTSAHMSNTSAHMSKRNTNDAVYFLVTLISKYIPFIC